MHAYRFAYWSPLRLMVSTTTAELITHKLQSNFSEYDYQMSSEHNAIQYIEACNSLQNNIRFVVLCVLKYIGCRIHSVFIYMNTFISYSREQNRNSTSHACARTHAHTTHYLVYCAFRNSICAKTETAALSDRPTPLCPRTRTDKL
jgi:hypothetical protein